MRHLISFNSVVGIFMSLLLFLGGVVFASGKERESLFGQGYDCMDGEHISVERLQEAVKLASRPNTYKKLVSPSYRARYKNHYNGPPFTRSYLLWPVSPFTDSYERAMEGPYRVVLDDEFKVFSVIMEQDGIRECKMRESLLESHHRFNFYCSGKSFLFAGLLESIAQACPHIRKDNSYKRLFPVRYEGSRFRQNGLQLYEYPIKENGIWKEEEGEDPGRYRLIMNSGCFLVGVIDYFRNIDHACHEYPVEG